MVSSPNAWPWPQPAARVSSLAPVVPLRSPGARAPQRPRPAPVPLDETGPFGGMGRSLTFPFRQWRDDDEHQTVFFDEGRGHPLVFVHGLGGNCTNFELLVGELVKQYRVVGIDVLGLGWTAKPNVPYRIEMLRDHLLGFLERHEIERPTLVGHSLGGAVVLSAALAAPDRFHSLALLCAAGLAPLPAWMRVAAPLAMDRRILFATLALGANVISQAVFSDREEHNAGVRWFRQSSLRDDPGYPNLREFARVCESLCVDLVGRNYSAELPTLGLPVLALWGDADKLTCQANVLRAMGKIRRVRTVVLRRCGHMPMIERPTETLFHIKRLLDSPP